MKTKHQFLIAVILVCITTITFSQVTKLDNVRPNTTAYLGWDGTGSYPGSLDVMNNFSSQPINFYLSGTQYMSLTSSGDLNLVNSARRYQINGNNVLWFNGDPSDIFLGVGAGNATMTGHGNTFLGKDAGTVNSSGGTGTFVGSSSGAANTTGYGNTFTGYQAGWKNIDGDFNSFFGGGAGYGTNNDANNNTFLGYASGGGNTTGDDNTMIGENAGANNSTGTRNTVVGARAGLGVTGSIYNNNSYFGYRAGYSNKTASNNVAMGFEACSLNTFSEENVAIGYQAMAKQAYGTVAWSGYNTAIGTGALFSTNSTSTTNGYQNTAVGYKAGYLNATGTSNTFFGFYSGYNNTASNNTFYGHGSGYNNTSASGNVFIGYLSGYYNQTGANNTFCGFEAGKGTATTNVNNYNSFFGYQAGKGTTTGTHNTATGNLAAFSHTTGQYNTVSGSNAAYSNQTGGGNTISGYQAGYSNTTSYNTFYGYRSGYATTGARNVFVGSDAGFINTTGTDNTCIGYQATLGGTGLVNATAIGVSAVVDASYKVRIGDANVTVIEGQVDWSFPSDGRFKNNVTEDIKGLEFIKKLRPVTYKFDTKAFETFVMKNIPDSIKSEHLNADFVASSNIIHNGFIAQEVEQAAKDVSYNFSGLHIPANADEHYSLSYAQFVVPLVKSVQELSKAVDSLKTELITIKGGGQRTYENNDSQGKSETSLNIELANNNQTILYQNEPNPFDGSTIIRYFVSENVSGNVSVLFCDMYGKEIKKLEITERGFGKIDANTENLASGVYSYSIMVDGKTIDTKKMLKAQ